MRLSVAPWQFENTSRRQSVNRIVTNGTTDTLPKRELSSIVPPAGVLGSNTWNGVGASPAEVTPSLTKCIRWCVCVRLSSCYYSEEAS